MTTECNGSPNSSSGNEANSSNVPEMILWVGVPILDNDNASVFDEGRSDGEGGAGAGSSSSSAFEVDLEAAAASSAVGHGGCR